MGDVRGLKRAPRNTAPYPVELEPIDDRGFAPVRLVRRAGVRILVRVEREALVRQAPEGFSSREYVFPEPGRSVGVGVSATDPDDRDGAVVARRAHGRTDRFESPRTRSARSSSAAVSAHLVSQCLEIMEPPYSMPIARSVRPCATTT